MPMVRYIQAWASALLVLTIMGNPEPQSVGRVMVRLPRFFRIWHFKNNYKLSVQGEADKFGVKYGNISKVICCSLSLPCAIKHVGTDLERTN